MRFWNRRETELEREIAHHLHYLAAEYERQGHSREEALRLAKREFGGAEQVKEQCRDERRWAWMNGLRQDLDLRHAHDAQDAGGDGRGGAVAGARHRREHGDRVADGRGAVAQACRCRIRNN